MIRPLSDVLSKLGLIDVILAVVLCPNWGFRPRWRPGRYGNFDIVLDQFHENLNPPPTHTHTHTHTCAYIRTPCGVPYLRQLRHCLDQFHEISAPPHTHTHTHTCAYIRTPCGVPYLAIRPLTPCSLNADWLIGPCNLRPGSSLTASPSPLHPPSHPLTLSPLHAVTRSLTHPLAPSPA